MTSFAITTYTTAGQTLSSYDNGVITSTGTLNRVTGNAVSVTNFSVQVSKLAVFGALMSQGNGTSSNAVDFLGSDFSLFVGAGGSVLTLGSNTIAIDLDANYQVTIANHGSISGIYNAIQSSTGDTYSNFELMNVGDITSGNVGIYFVTQKGYANILNSGTIIGSSFGFNSTLGATGAHITILDNTGIIQGGVASYAGSDGVDYIRNAGVMSGPIKLRLGDDTYIGDSGTVVGPVFGEAGNDKIIGGVAGDTFDGGIDNDVLVGNGGDDTLDGGYGDDVLRGGEGNDTLTGGAGVDKLRGHQGDDVLDGGTENDDLRAGAGDDTLLGGDGSDILRAGDGDDDLSGGTGADKLFGGAGNDRLIGDGQKDALHGGDGNDALKGGAGNDTLNGGHDDDVLTGGAGNDVFVFARNAGNDRITDFANTKDSIDLTAFGINPLDFASIVVPALSDAGGGDTLLNLADLGGQGSVLIEGLAFASADASDFIL